MAIKLSHFWQWLNIRSVRFYGNNWLRLCVRAPCNASLLHIETETSLHFCEVFTHSAQHEGSIHTWQGRFVELSSPALRKLCVHLLSFARLSWLSVLGAPSR